MVGCDTNLSSNDNGLVNADPASRVSGADVLAHVRAGSFEGIFALSEAAPPKGVSAEGLGSFAWWNDFSSGQMYLYSRLINTPADANDALVNLERDLGVDSSDMIAELSLVDGESNAANQLEDPAGWKPATFALALEIMGVDPADYIDASKGLFNSVDCIAGKSVAEKEASLKSLPSPLKSILLVSQAGCGFGPCVDPCSCAHCSDQNVCNGVETCQSGVGCVYGDTLVCDDKNYCNGHETCDQLSGCQPGDPPVCDDDNVCNGLEFCLDNELVTGCQPGTPLDCDDGNDCNGIETCDPIAGCQPGTPVICSDNNVCNGLETCSGGTCFPGTPLMCNDNNVCNGIEYCDPILGCQLGTVPNCDDGNICNGPETCNPTGGCQLGTPPPDCTACDPIGQKQCFNGACRGASCYAVHGDAQGCAGELVNLPCAVTNNRCDRTFTWRAVQVGGLATVLSASGSITVPAQQTINVPVQLSISPQSAAGLAIVELRITAAGDTSPTCIDTATVTVKTDEVITDSALNAQLLDLPFFESALNAIPAVSVSSGFTVSVGGTYKESLVCCPGMQGMQATKKEANGSLSATIGLQFTLPGASNAIPVTLPAGLGAGAVSYTIGPAIETKLGGGSITVTGARTELPCEGGCVSIGFGVPFSITVSAGASLNVWFDVAFIGDFAGSATAQVSATIGDISVTGNHELFGTGCSDNSVSVTAGAATGAITFSVKLFRNGVFQADWTTTFANVTLWDGLP